MVLSELCSLSPCPLALSVASCVFPPLNTTCTMQVITAMEIAGEQVLRAFQGAASHVVNHKWVQGWGE